MATLMCLECSVRVDINSTAGPVYVAFLQLHVFFKAPVTYNRQLAAVLQYAIVHNDMYTEKIFHNHSASHYGIVMHFSSASNFLCKNKDAYYRNKHYIVYIVKI